MNEPAIAMAAMVLWAGVGPAAVAEEADRADDMPPGGLAELWQQMRASAVWRTDYFSSSKTLDDASGFLGTTLQLKALPDLTDTLSAKFEVRATNSALDGGAGTQTRLLEGYVAMNFTQADLYLGRQIVAWGRADGINPTDNLTPRDYKVLLPFEEDQRFGTTALKLDVHLPQERTVTVFATPFFEPSKVPLPGTGRAISDRTPAHTLSNTEVGLKLDEVGEGYDWSVSYFRGFSLLPTVQLPDLGSESAIELHYDRITVLGADVARNYGRFGLRGELAYVDTADDAGADPGVKNSYLYWVAGVDRTFYENLNVNLQFFQRRVRSHRNPQGIDDARARTTALLNSLFDGQRDHVSNGITFRVSNLWLNNTLEAEIFAVINFTRDDSLLRPLVTYAFDDHWSATIGGEFYRGGGDTQYGSLKLNRTAFVEVRYGF